MFLCKLKGLGFVGELQGPVDLALFSRSNAVICFDDPVRPSIRSADGMEYVLEVTDAEMIMVHVAPSKVDYVIGQYHNACPVQSDPSIPSLRDRHERRPGTSELLAVARCSCSQATSSRSVTAGFFQAD